MEWEDEWTGNTKRDKAGNNYFESTLQYLGKGKVLNRFVSESLLNPAWIQVIDISCFQGLFFFGLPDQIEINRFPNRPSDWQRHHGSHLNGTTPGLWRHGSHVPLRGSFGGAKGPWSSFGGTDGTREDDGWWLEAFIRFWCHTWHNKNINGMAIAFWKKPAIFFLNEYWFDILSQLSCGSLFFVVQLLMGISTYVNWYCKLQACFFFQNLSQLSTRRVLDWTMVRQAVPMILQARGNAKFVIVGI